MFVHILFPFFYALTNERQDFVDLQTIRSEMKNKAKKRRETITRRLNASEHSLCVQYVHANANANVVLMVNMFVFHRIQISEP